MTPEEEYLNNLFNKPHIDIPHEGLEMEYEEAIKLFPQIERTGFITIDTKDGIDKRYNRSGELVEVWTKEENKDGRA